MKKGGNGRAIQCNDFVKNKVFFEQDVHIAFFHQKDVFFD